MKASRGNTRHSAAEDPVVGRERAARPDFVLEMERAGRGERRPDPAILSREDIGYGPGRPYEFDYGPAMPAPRERRAGGAGRRATEPPVGEQGPYRGRLRRRRRPDHWIRADVERALFYDTWVDSDRILVDVDRGVVTLTGTLAEPAEIRRAIRDASRVPGVESVRNHLETEA